MADQVILGSTGGAVAAELVAASTEYYQRIKLFDPTPTSTAPHGVVSNPFRIDPTGGTVQPVSGTFWQSTQPVVVSTGHLIVDSGTITTKESPDATSTFVPTAIDSTGYEASHIIKASAGVLYSLCGYNSKTGSQFIQVHNSATVPADTAAPLVIFTVPAASNFSYSPSEKFGKFFSAGIVVCNSQTGPTKTIGSTDCWFSVLYQ